MAASTLLTSEKARYAHIEAPCRYFGTCGGCSLQDLAYADQVRLKRERLQGALASVGVDHPIEVVALEEPWRYRNKAEFTFGESDGRLVLGYHAARSFWRVVDLDDCLLLPEPVMRVVRDVCALAGETGLPAYQPKTHQGFFRYLLVRHSGLTGTTLLCLMTAPGPRDAVERVAHRLMERHAAISGIYWGVTSRVADVALPDELTLLCGAAYLEEQLGPFQLRLLPLSFLQPTSALAERMYELLCRCVEERLGLRPDDQGRAGKIAWDLYCGVGVVGFYLSRYFGKIYGIDLEPGYVQLAELNASLNGVRNVVFRAGRVETVLSDRRFWLQEAKPDLVVVDPPRVGLHPRALSAVLSARPSAVAYLSCNVQSLVRDLRLLACGFPRYRLTTIQAFDMFPQTNHVETFAFLERQ